jgi:thimet oligopeptidase
MVRDFLGRDEEFTAFSKWLNEEFDNQLISATA